MKCRIVQCGDKFKAQYAENKVFQGRHARSKKVWCTLETGDGEPIFFNSANDAELAIRSYAIMRTEGSVVKEFEV